MAFRLRLNRQSAVVKRFLLMRDVSVLELFSRKKVNYRILGGRRRALGVATPFTENPGIWHVMPVRSQRSL